jgi:hypothetical protein
MAGVTVFVDDAVLGRFPGARWSIAPTLVASRRWVTLDGVHDDFAALVRTQQRTSPSP